MPPLAGMRTRWPCSTAGHPPDCSTTEEEEGTREAGGRASQRSRRPVCLRRLPRRPRRRPTRRQYEPQRQLLRQRHHGILVEQLQTRVRRWDLSHPSGRQVVGARPRPTRVPRQLAEPAGSGGGARVFQIVAARRDFKKAAMRFDQRGELIRDRFIHFSGNEEPFRRHAVLRERTGLVRADDRGAAERLDRGQMADQRVAFRHALPARLSR